MAICSQYRRIVRWTAAVLLIAALMAGCAGIKPYEPRNNREEGPQKGLFTGSQGEWVIVGPKAPSTGAEEGQNGAPGSETQREEKKDPTKPAASEQ